MPRPIKTIPVSFIKDEINRLLAREDEFMTDDRREVLCSVWESVAHKTNNYNGYNYVDWLNGGSERWFADGEPGFPEKEKYFGPNFKRKYY